LGFQPLQQRDVLAQSLRQQRFVEPLQREPRLQLQIAKLIQHQSMGGMTAPGHHLLQQTLQQCRIMGLGPVRLAACKRGAQQQFTVSGGQKEGITIDPQMVLSLCVGNKSI